MPRKKGTKVLEQEEHNEDIEQNESVESQEEHVEEVVKEEPKAEVAVAKPLPPQAPQMPIIESVIEGGVVHARVYPQVRVGVCEFHGTPYGVVDKTTLKGKCFHQCATDPLCPHSKTGCPHRPIYDIIDGQEVQVGEENYCRHEHNYKGLTFRCTYCPKDANMREVIEGRTLYVFGSPEDPNKLIVCCSDFRCRSQHAKRFGMKVI